MQLPLQPIEPTSDKLTQWKAEPRWSFGPFDESRFGFHSIALILERIPLDCQSDFSDKHAVTHVVIAVQRAGGADYWALSEPYPQKDGDPCERDTNTTWSLTDVARESPTAGMATPDVTIPIFQVSYTATWSGRTSVGTAHRLIIDARTAQPLLAARLSSVEVDGFCQFSPERPDATCTWDGQRHDFLCTESFRDAQRYVWMMSGDRLPRLPDSPPPRLAGFIDVLVSSPTAVGTWAEPADVGAVRLVAEIPSKERGRRIFLFGASDRLGAPFVLAVREKDRTRVLPVKIDHADLSEPRTFSRTFSPVSNDAPPIPLAEYRLTGEPPTFKSQQLTQDRLGTRLLRVVTEVQDSGVRNAFHIAIQEVSDTVVAHAIHFASSHRDPKVSFLAITSDGPLD